MLYLTADNGDILNWDNIVKVKKDHFEGVSYNDHPAGTSFYAIDVHGNQHKIHFIPCKTESPKTVEEFIQENIKRTSV